MDPLFLCIHGIKNIVGAAQVKLLDKSIGKDVDSWLPIMSAEWNVTRTVTMDVGNANNSDTGEVTAGELIITKKVDGLTPALNTILYKPIKGRCFDIIYTTPEMDGSGLVSQRELTFSDAKVIDYSVSTDNDEEAGSTPIETIKISYECLIAKFNPTDALGVYGERTTSMVVYDFTTAKLEAGAEMK